MAKVTRCGAAEAAAAELPILLCQRSRRVEGMVEIRRYCDQRDGKRRVGMHKSSSSGSGLERRTEVYMP
jgi:hypothetical protein